MVMMKVCHQIQPSEIGIVEAQSFYLQKPKILHFSKRLGKHTRLFIAFISSDDHIEPMVLKPRRRLITK